MDWSRSIEELENDNRSYIVCSFCQQPVKDLPSHLLKCDAKKEAGTGQ